MKRDKERKLAAIMLTDMVGYNALAQKDESLSLELLEEHQNILRPYFPKHDGRKVETIGDAFFVEFSSALEAVKCAIDIQKELWERNKNVPAERIIKIRIGISMIFFAPTTVFKKYLLPIKRYMPKYGILPLY